MRASCRVVTATIVLILAGTAARPADMSRAEPV
jgi:hypothetical protein